jgi:hypothetical protein
LARAPPISVSGPARVSSDNPTAANDCKLLEADAMIDPMTDELISLADAAKRLPARRGGKRPHVALAQ